MANDCIRYEQALDTWQSHLDTGNLSVPSEVGTIAILVPYVNDFDTERPATERLLSFETEAYELADNAKAQDRKVEVAVNATPIDFKGVLQDASISDIILIGHGCLASVEVASPETNNRLDWEDLSIMADHLKTGRVVQRVCAALPRDLNVPIGLLVVSDHRNVHALVGQSVTSEGLAEFTQVGLLPVTSLARMEYADVKSEFPKQKLSPVSRVHVALGAMKRAVLERVTA